MTAGLSQMEFICTKVWNCEGIPKMSDMSSIWCCCKLSPLPGQKGQNNFQLYFSKSHFHLICPLQMVNLMRTSGIIQTKIKKKTWYICIKFKCILVSNNLATIEIVLKYYWNNRHVRKGNLLSFKVTVCIISPASDNSTFNTQAKMQSIFFVGRRCYIVPICL